MEDKNKLELVDNSHPRDSSPTFGDRLSSVGKRAVRATGDVLTSPFVLATGFIGGILGGLYLLSESAMDARQEREHDNALFRNEYVKTLEKDGYKVLAHTAFYRDQCGCGEQAEDKGKETTFSGDFDKAALFTVQRNDSISDVLVVREVISKTGYTADRVAETAFIRKASQKR